MLRDHGQAKKYHHEFEGYNGRLDTIQAGLLSVKLPRLAMWNDLRRSRAAEYGRLLARKDAIVIPHEPSWSRAVYHIYAIRTGARETLVDHLKRAGITTGIHYPIPLHLQNAYVSMKQGPGSFPVAEKTAAEILSLPIFPHISFDQQKYVADAIGAFAGRAFSACVAR